MKSRRIRWSNAADKHGLGNSLNTQIVLRSKPFEDDQPRPILPTELMELIIDDLGHNSNEAACRQALRSCALVSTLFCMRAYKYLVSDLRIIMGRKSSSEIKTRLRKLRKILVGGLNFPHLGMVYYIQSVWFAIALQKSGYEDLPAILDALHGPNHGISRLDFVAIPTGYEGLGVLYDLFRNHKFSKAFQILCRSPKLNRLYLKNFTMVPRNILRGENIKHLILENFGPLRESERAETPHTNIVRPTSLTLIECVPFAKIIDILLPSEHTLDMKSCHPPIFASLEEITIDEGNSSIPLYLMPKLRSVCFVQRDANETCAGDAISSINDFFSRPGRNIPNTVTRLAIETKYLHPRTFLDLSYSDWEKAKEQWDLLDINLAETLLQNIQDVHLVIRFGKDLIQDLLPSESVFLARNKQVIWTLLPRVVTLQSTGFSLELFLDPERDMSALPTGIHRKGPQTDWW